MVIGLHIGKDKNIFTGEVKYPVFLKIYGRGDKGIRLKTFDNKKKAFEFIKNVKLVK